MEKTYISPEMEVVIFDQQDIIVTSNGDDPIELPDQPVNN